MRFESIFSYGVCFIIRRSGFGVEFGIDHHLLDDRIVQRDRHRRLAGRREVELVGIAIARLSVAALFGEGELRAVLGQGLPVRVKRPGAMNTASSEAAVNSKAWPAAEVSVKSSSWNSP